MNKNFYEDEGRNALRISEYHKYNGEVSFNNVAAKFVVDGSETYIVNGKQFFVRKGEYIIGNNNQLTEVYIGQKTRGLCVDISNEIISEIIENQFENPDLREFMLTDKFLINKYNSQHTNLGLKLNYLSKALIHENRESLLNAELFYSIGENIVNDHALIFEQISKLNYKKQEVNDDVFRSLLAAKYFIEDNFLEPIQLDDLVNIALISKYAFIRLFKSTFGITPYQYIVHRRLLHSKSLILNGEKISNIAFDIGFADVPTFSKAFRKYFGISPSSVAK